MQLADSLLRRGVECVPPPRIIATTGWRTDQLKAAIKEAGLAKDYDLVSLLIGVNNQYQGKSAESYKPEFEELLKTAIELAGGDKLRVFVISIHLYRIMDLLLSGKRKKNPSPNRSTFTIQSIAASLKRLALPTFPLPIFREKVLNNPTLLLRTDCILPVKCMQNG
jgi:hypothetical protein